jgi:spermidine synthase
LGLKSPILKLSLFATGLSGIVAEYILSTLASYFIGDSVIQWTLIVSVMLFSMGIGARLSKLFKKNLLVVFIFIELILSVLVSFSSLITYLSAGFSIYIGFVIYSLSIVIGILIGLEIPLVIRLNTEFESLRINIASVMEKDYWGSLIGGIFFAFVGLPYLGLTYTPFILGGINFLVAVVLLVSIRKELKHWGRLLIPSTLLTAFLIVGGLAFAEPVILYGEQSRYRDKVIYYEQSQYQRLVITEWRGENWLYINGNQQFSTVDEDKYHEPLVHPAMHLAPLPRNILILGGGDGIAAKEVLKYKSVASIRLVDLDPAMTKLANEHPVLLKANEGSFGNEKVEVINRDGFKFLEGDESYYDVIIIDLPDPKSVDLNRLYTREFYELCRLHLRDKGVLVAQAGSPYFATQAYVCIDTTMESAGFQTVRLHNHVVTLGEWGWILGVKGFPEMDLKEGIKNLSFEDVETKWLNQEAMTLMTSFGKDIYFDEYSDTEVNTIQNPVLYRYYLKGNWDLY